MKTYPLVISTLTALGLTWTAGVSEAQLVDGQVLGIDFGNGIWTSSTPTSAAPAEKGSGSETNFATLVQNRNAGGTIGRSTAAAGMNVTGQAIATDIAGTALTGVTFSTSGFGGFLAVSDQVGYNAAGVGNYTGTDFSDLSFNDGIYGSGAGAKTITISGLDDALK
jgi:hypothetical protein